MMNLKTSSITLSFILAASAGLTLMPFANAQQPNNSGASAQASSDPYHVLKGIIEFNEDDKKSLFYQKLSNNEYDVNHRDLWSSEEFLAFAKTLDLPEDRRSLEYLDNIRTIYKEEIGEFGTYDLEMQRKIALAAVKISLYVTGKKRAFTPEANGALQDIHQLARDTGLDLTRRMEPNKPVMLWNL